MSSPDQGGEDRHQAHQNDARVVTGQTMALEVEEIEDGEAFIGAASRDGVVAGLIAAGTVCAFRDVENGGDAGAVELIGEFEALQRKPVNDMGPKCECETVRVEPVQRSGWRGGRDGSGGGIHQWKPFRGREARPSP